MNVIIATSNSGKFKEIAAMLDPMGISVEQLSAPVDETGETIMENARIKGLAYSTMEKSKGSLCIAEDSGIVVPALKGLPGPYSARFHLLELDDDLNVVGMPKEVYSTDKRAADLANNARLLELLKNTPEYLRAAYYEVAFVIYKDGECIFSCEKRSYGYIGMSPVGENGFGYDPIFHPVSGGGRTYGEIDSLRKNLSSHRSKAMAELTLFLSTNV